MPGLIHTAMWEQAATEIADATGGTMEAVLENNGKNVPVGRYGTSEEVAALIVFCVPMRLLTLMRHRSRWMEVGLLTYRVGC